VVRARGLLGAVRDGAKRRPDRRFPALYARERRGDRTKLELRLDPSRDGLGGDPGAAGESSFTRLDSLLRRSR